jgi:hypothetical protein
VSWPGADVAILGILAVYIVLSVGLVTALRRRRSVVLGAAA